MNKPTKLWMVRAGFKSALADAVVKKNAVALGWPEMGDLSKLEIFSEYRSKYIETHPSDKPIRVSVITGQIHKFVKEINVGDYVITSVVPLKRFLVGQVVDGYQYDPLLFAPDYPHIRKVKWLGTVERADLTVEAQRSLRSILMVFNVDKHMDEILQLLEKNR